MQLVELVQFREAVQFFQIINREICSIIPTSDDWYYFRVKR